MKKLLALAMSLALTLTLFAGCTSPAAKTTPAPAGSGTPASAPVEPSKETHKIGVVIPSGDHGFTGESVAQAKLEAELLMQQYEGLEVIVKDGIDASAQITSIENMLNSGDMDLIMLWPMEGEALRSAAQTIIDAGVELVVYDRLITDFQGLVGEIMGDNVGIGNAMGEYLNKFYGDMDKVQYLRFVGDSSTVTGQRSDGMDEKLDAKFEQVANTFVTDWSSEKAQTQMEDWLNSKSQAEIEDLDLIVTHDDEIVDGLMNALEAYTGSAKINVKLITSVGGREETMQKFENTKLGVKFCTFFFSPSFIRESLILSATHVYGEPYTGATKEGQTYLIPSFSITNADVAGDYTFDTYRATDAYANRYAIK
ncbi:MAG: LacI family transcriptional regulator [Clostridia bacterium]|nr:LacI family transcriptional regulator [Clostridia bacterium]